MSYTDGGQTMSELSSHIQKRITGVLNDIFEAKKKDPSVSMEWHNGALFALIEFHSFLVMDGKSKKEEIPPESPAEKWKNRNISDLGIESRRLLNCLSAENIYLVGELLNVSIKDLLKTPNFGRKSLRELNDALNRHGLMLRSE